MFGARFGGDAGGAGTDRFERNAAALEHRDQTQAFGSVDDDFERGSLGPNPAREVRDRAQVGAPARLFAPVAAVAAIFRKRGTEADGGGRHKAPPLRSTAIKRSHRTHAIRPGKAGS